MVISALVDSICTEHETHSVSFTDIIYLYFISFNIACLGNALFKIGEHIY